jgi:hypothetical protein
MHWGTVFTIMVAAFAALAAVLSPILAYRATQKATREQLRDALTARLDAETAEHRRWLRDHTVEVYIELLAANRKMSNAASDLSWSLGPEDPEVFPVVDRNNAMEGLRHGYRDVEERLTAFASEQVRELVIAARLSGYRLCRAARGSERPETQLFQDTHQALRRIDAAVRAELQLPNVGIRPTPRPRLESNQRPPVPETGGPE